MLRLRIAVIAALLLCAATISVVCAAPDNTTYPSGSNSFNGGILTDQGSNVLALQPTSDSIYVKPSHSVHLTLNQFYLASPVVGYQAFIEFDTSKLAFVSGAYTEIPYNMPILGITASGGNIDLANGSVTPTSTSAMLADLEFTVPPGVADTTTQVVFRQHDPPTQFTDNLGNPITPVLSNSTYIYIDSTPPTNVEISANPSTWTNTGLVTLLFSATDALSGIDHYELSLNGGVFFHAASPYQWDISALPTGTYGATVKAFDRSGNESAPASTTVYVDHSNPTISIDSASQGGGPNLIPAGTALQGIVDIYVSAADVGSGLNGQPAVTVTPNGGGPEPAAFIGQSAGVFHYQWTVIAGTPNGAAAINATVSDIAGNSASASPKTILVNKSQATVVLELERVQTNVTRMIKFYLGGSGGVVAPQPITKPVNFVWDGVATHNAIGTVVLTDLPNNGLWTKISAKDEQHTLRRTITLSGDVNNQFQASFTGPKMLIGGDVTNDNLIDIRDWGICYTQYGSSLPLDTQWPTRNANITCDGSVDTSDFTYVQIHFLAIGDAQVGGTVEVTSVEKPMTSISVSALNEIAGNAEAGKADQNGDGIVDAKDVLLFVQSNMNVKHGR